MDRSEDAASHGDTQSTGRWLGLFCLRFTRLCGGLPSGKWLRAFGDTHDGTGQRSASTSSERILTALEDKSINRISPYTVNKQRQDLRIAAQCERKVSYPRRNCGGGLSCARIKAGKHTVTQLSGPTTFAQKVRSSFGDDHYCTVFVAFLFLDSAGTVH